MIAQLILNLLDVNATTGVSVNLLDSEGTGVRVYHQRVWQGHSFPAVVFDVLADVPQYKKAAMTLRDYTVTFSIHHENDFEADTIADNLVILLEGYAGTYSGKDWKYTMLERIVDGFTDDLNLPRKVVDFQFTREN